MHFEFHAKREETMRTINVHAMPLNNPPNVDIWCRSAVTLIELRLKFNHGSKSAD